MINIFGTSEKINELGEAEINRLLNSDIPSIGINRFCEYYSKVDHICFVDTDMAERLTLGKYGGQGIITCEHAYKHFFKNKPEFKITTIFEPNNMQLSVGNSAFYALWWAVSQGYKEANLYGILDGNYDINPALVQWKHFYEVDDQPSVDFDYRKWQKFTQLMESGINGQIKVNFKLR